MTNIVKLKTKTIQRIKDKFEAIAEQARKEREIKKKNIDGNLYGDIQFNEEHAFELVLDCHEIVRFIGISPQKDDYYWVTMDFRGECKYLSAVGALWPLKGVLPDDQYDYLDYFFRINNIFTSEKDMAELHKTWNARQDKKKLGKKEFSASV